MNKDSETTSTCRECGQAIKNQRTIVGSCEIIQRTCDKCLEKEEERYRKEQQLRLQLARKRRYESICSKNMQTFNPQQSPSNHQLTERVLRWQKGPQGLLIHGATGSGKTRVLWQLIKRLIVDDGCTVKAYRATELARAIETSYRQPTGHDTFIQSLIQAEIFMLDDLGKFKWTERVEADLFDIIDGRTANDKPILVTTQYVGETLAKRFLDPETASATIRRLREYCECIDFS